MKGGKYTYIYKVPSQDSGQKNISYTRYPKKCFHRRTGNFLPGAALNLLPKKFSQVARIFTTRTVEKKRGSHDATT